MRLTCPNCGAQYEVPDDVIPLAGRDVQCSSCGNTWFQNHPEAEADSEPEDFALADTAPDTEEPTPEEGDTETFEEIEPPEIVFEDGSDEDPKADGGEHEMSEQADGRWLDEDELETSESYDEEVSDDSPETEWETATSDDPDEDPASDARRRGLDPAIADVLRQEAEHEARARAADSLETQPELGLSEPENETDKRLLQAKARMRRLRGLPSEPTPEVEAEPAKPDSRRDLLPDIEEINSTLRGGSDTSRTNAANAGAPTSAKRRSGFRLGFGVALLIALAGILAYSYDAEIAEAYPPAAPYLEKFIASSNEGRVWLDSQVTSLFIWLNGFTGS